MAEMKGCSWFERSWGHRFWGCLLFIYADRVAYGSRSKESGSG